MAASKPGETVPSAALTELCGDDGDVVPGVLLSVQLPDGEQRTVSRVDVEHLVHVCAPVDGVPTPNTQSHRELVEMAVPSGML